MSKILEVRSAPEVRAIAESRTVEGYAALFNSRTELWPGMYEVIKPGAFKEALKTSDVRALFDHKSDKILARTKSGTLQLWEDEIGLKYRFDSPNTTAGNDLLVSLERRDIAESSFSFYMDGGREEWSRIEGGQLREIHAVGSVADISPVTYAAYTDTTAAKRSAEVRNAQFEADQKPKYTGNENRSRLLDLYAKQLK